MYNIYESCKIIGQPFRTTEDHNNIVDYKSQQLFYSCFEYK